MQWRNGIGGTREKFADKKSTGARGPVGRPACRTAAWKTCLWSWSSTPRERLIRDSHTEAQTGALFEGRLRPTHVDGRHWDLEPGSGWYMDADEDYSLSTAPFEGRNVVFVVSHTRRAASNPAFTNPQLKQRKLQQKR